MRYLKGEAGSAPLGLVGKGVTFDSGGLSLKPSESMLDMKCDMSGAAAVVGAMMAISRLELPVNVIGFVGLAENMVSGDSYKLGDVLTARNGKTIEVHNTDAEGRLVLADTLDVAVTSGVDRIDQSSGGNDRGRYQAAAAGNVGSFIVRLEREPVHNAQPLPQSLPPFLI